MKKPVSMVLAFLLICALSIGIAEDVNLSGLSFDQLVALKDRINLAIWNSAEWQEVTVPQGVWIVGEDIPAGKWTVRCADLGRNDYLMKSCEISWGTDYDKSKNSIPVKMRLGKKEIYNPNSTDYKSGQVTEVTIDLEDGNVVVIHDMYNKAVFSPYAGKPDLGFK